MVKLKNNYLKNRLLYNSFLLLCLFFINCFWGNIVYVTYPLLLILVLVDSLKNGFSYIVFTMPYCLLKHHVSVVLYFACALAYILKLTIILVIKEKLKIDKKILILIGLFALYCLIPFAKYDLNVLVKICMFIFLFAAIIFIGKKPEIFRLDFNVYLLATSLTISVIFSLTYYFSPYAHALLDGGQLSYLVRYKALFDNPNVLSMTCELLMPMLVYFTISRKSKPYEILLIASIAIIGSLTFSKTFYIILCLVLILLFITTLKRSPEKTLSITTGVLIVITLLAIFRFEIFVQIWNRFFGYVRDCKSFADMMNMITTHRYDLWVAYVKYIFQNSPVNRVFGYGLGASPLYMYSAHNAYISMLYQLGVVGSILFIAPIVLIIRELIREKNAKVHKAVWLPIIVLALVLCVEDAIFYIIF